jgi:hypothetical protein
LIVPAPQNFADPCGFASGSATLDGSLSFYTWEIMVFELVVIDGGCRLVYTGGKWKKLK